MPGSRALSDVADELYALPPEDFIAAREQAVRAARDEGDRELAAAVHQLRRPSIGAWLVNQVARNAGDHLDELLDLGAALREAQDALDGAELRAMSRQRHQVIRALSMTAGELAAEAGHRVGDAAQREFESTLDAALADERAAAGIRTGRLMRALSSTGLEPVDLNDAIAAPDRTATQPVARGQTTRLGAPKPTAAQQSPAKQAVAKKAAAEQAAAEKATNKQAAASRAAAERAARDARAELDRADSALEHSQSELAAARARIGQARDRVAELDAALAAAHDDLTAGEQSRREADQAVKAARRTREAAQRAVQTAENQAAR